MSGYGSATFDPELVEMTVHTDTGFTVEIYKLGGGTLGRPYEGLWGYRVTRRDEVVAAGEDLLTGMPKTHQEAALIVLDTIELTEENQ